MPKFLIDTYGFTKKEIMVDYNIVKTSWIIHFLIHLIRLVEYGQPKEIKAVKTFTFNKCEEFSFCKCDDPYQSLAKTFTTIFNSHLLQNYPEFEIRLKQYRNKRLEKATQKNISNNVKKVLSVNTLWRDCNEHGNEIQHFEFIHPAQNPDHYTLKTLSTCLINAYNKKMLIMVSQRI